MTLRNHRLASRIRKPLTVDDVTATDEESEEQATLHVSEPHGQHAILLIEDHEQFDNRIFEIRSDTQRIGILGWELRSLAAWVAVEASLTHLEHAD